MSISLILLLVVTLVRLAIFAFVIYAAVQGVKALRKYNRSGEVRKEKAETRRSLGEVLKEHRVRCKMTQEFVAESLGVSRQAVSKWETGESLPDLYKLAALADELGVSTDELCGREAALCGEVPATAFAGDAAEREAFAEEIRRIAKQNRSLRYVVGILVLICGVLTMLSGYRSLQNSKAPSNEITTPAPLPDTITISGLTLDIDGIALVFRFVPSVSGEGYEWSASCAPDNNGLISVETTTDGGICTVRLLNVSQYDGVTLSATVTNGTESRSICLATDIRVGENSISWDPQV